MKTPEIEVLRDVAVKPYTQRAPHFYGGIEADRINEAGRVPKGRGFRDIAEPIERTSSRGFFRRSQTLPTLKGKWLFGGPMWSHFGHFFTDCIHRLWPLIDDPDAYDGVVFLGVKGLMGINTDARLASSSPPSFLADLMAALGLSDVPVTFITQPTVIEALATPMAGFALHAPVQNFYRPYLRVYQDRISDFVADYIAEAPEKLYLGRSHFLRKGGILGSRYWQAVLEANGFTASTPEKFPLAKQMGHLLGAKTIVMDEGSAAMPALVFDRLKAEFFMFPRRTGRNPFQNMVGQRAAFTTLVPPDNIAVLPDRYGGTSSPGGVAAYRDPRAVFDDLVARGFIQGTFDPAAYRAAEDADLDAADCNTPMVKDMRRGLLNAARADRADG